MSESESDSNAIDSKKTENTDTTKSVNYAGFTTGLITYTIHIIISFVLIGSMGLYMCKIAQSNVLPDNLKYAPFGDKIKDVEQIPININVVKVYGLMGMGMFLGQKPSLEESTKIVFDSKQIAESYNKGVLGLLESLKTNPERAGFFGLYFTDVLSSIIATNNIIINGFFGFMNQYLPETFILFIFPFIVLLFIIFMLFLNIILAFFYQLSHWSDFFMHKVIKNNKVVWEDPITFFRPLRAFFFFLYLLFLFVPFIAIFPLLTTLYSLFAPLGLSATIYKTDQQFGFLQFLKDVIIYKNQFYLILLTLGLLSQSSVYLGQNGIIGCLVGILIVMFGLHLYNQFVPNNDKYETEGLVSSAPAKVKSSQEGGYKKKMKK
jgi:hypothetical protein